MAGNIRVLGVYNQASMTRQGSIRRQMPRRESGMMEDNVASNPAFELHVVPMNANASI